MKRNFLFILLFISAFVGVKAQTTELLTHQTIWNSKSICSKISTDKISTGILDFYGVQPVMLSEYDGVCRDSNYVDLSTIKLLYYGIKTSSYRENKDCPSFDEFAKRLNVSRKNEVSPISAIIYKYNYIKEEAAQQNKIRYDKSIDKLIEEGDVSDIYGERLLFAAAPHKLIWENRTVNFELPKGSTIDLSSFEAGTYIVKFRSNNDNNVITQKIIVK